ncbi:MAG TPA: hypothetical protein VM580_12175, partial [Labilithrix sp.]|nr:hypothetical protein [Labilithrix sp.]
KWTQVRDDSIALAESNPDALPDYKAGELVLKHEALLAAVEGTDAPKRTELSGPDGSPIVGEVSPEAAARLVQEAFGSHAIKADDETGDTDDGGASPVPEGSPAE